MPLIITQENIDIAIANGWTYADRDGGVTTPKTIPSGPFVLGYNGATSDPVDPYITDGSTQTQLVALSGVKRLGVPGGIPASGNWSLVAEPAFVPPPVKAWGVTQANLNTLSANHLSMKVDGVLVSGPVDVMVGQVIVMETDSGHRIDYVRLMDPVTEELVNFTVSSSKLTATATLSKYANWNLQVKVDVYVPPPVNAYYVVASDVSGLAGSNLELYRNNVLITGSTQLYVGDVVEMRAVGPYHIDYAYFLNAGTEERLEFVLSLDRKVGTVVMEKAHYFYFASEVDSGEVDVRGSNSVFAVADEDLSKITSKRFTQPVTGGDVFDYGQFILGLIKLPFAVGPEMIVGPENIHLGNLNTGVSGQLLRTDRMTFSLGSVGVQGTRGDMLDYKNTSCVLHLPFVNSVDLSPDYVIDQTVTIDLVINLYDGTGNYRITSTKLDAPVVTVPVALDIDIPFANIEGTPNRNNAEGVQFGVDNGVLTPYVEVIRNEAVLPDGVFTAPIVGEGALSGVEGYVRVQEVKLEVVATARELADIEARLKEGVFVG